jgi:hypothetical protein
MYKDSITVDFAMLLNLYVKQVTKTMLKHRVSKTTLGALSKKTMLEYRHASTQRRLKYEEFHTQSIRETIWFESKSFFMY